MKLYGLRRAEVWTDDYTVGRYHKGYSRRKARTRRKDKLMFHRRARRTAKTTE